MALGFRCSIKVDTKIFSIVSEVVRERQKTMVLLMLGQGASINGFGRGLDDMNLSGDVHAALVPEPSCLSRDAGIVKLNISLAVDRCAASSPE